MCCEIIFSSGNFSQHLLCNLILLIVRCKGAITMGEEHIKSFDKMRVHRCTYWLVFIGRDFDDPDRAWFMLQSLNCPLEHH